MDTEVPAWSLGDLLSQKHQTNLNGNEDEREPGEDVAIREACEYVERVVGNLNCNVARFSCEGRDAVTRTNLYIHELVGKEPRKKQRSHTLPRA